MTEDKTHVITTELDTFARNAHSRSDRADSSANDLGEVQLETDTFGFVNGWLPGMFGEQIDSVITDIRDIAVRLTSDAETVEASSKEFKDTEQAQQDRMMSVDRTQPGGGR